MKLYLFLSVLATLATMVPAYGDSHDADATAVIIDKSGERIGVADLRQAPTGVLIHIRATSLAPGKHGLHLHSIGSCDSAAGFKTARGHVGKIEGAHGLMNPQGPEPGDLPNLFVGTDGIGETEVFTGLVSIKSGENPLLDEDGSTFIIHEAADDHITQPIGGAGGRVACGIIQATH